VQFPQLKLRAIFDRAAGTGAKASFAAYANGSKFNSKRVLDTNINAQETLIHETGSLSNTQPPMIQLLANRNKTMTPNTRIVCKALHAFSPG
jgi:hypothetical protein